MGWFVTVVDLDKMLLGSMCQLGQGVGVLSAVVNPTTDALSAASIS
jgi:hypothetical protein